MGSQVRLNPALPERIHQFSGDVDALAIYRASELLVIDDVPWRADFAVIQRGLVPQQRKFKQAFHDEGIPLDVWRELDLLRMEVDALRERLFPTPATECCGSFRPMISGPEPLHFDTYAAGNPVLTAFVNVSSRPRRYCIGRSLPGLVQDQPELMRKILREECKGNVDDLSYHIRTRTVRKDPPLGEPKHHVEFAPGAIWFFNAKTVSHELVYGEGAMGFSWEVPGAAPTQRQIVAGLP